MFLLNKIQLSKKKRKQNKEKIVIVITNQDKVLRTYPYFVAQNSGLTELPSLVIQLYLNSKILYKKHSF